MTGKIIERDVICIQSLIQKIFGFKECTNLERMGGLTNHTYKATLEDDETIVIRLPGEGTEELINRADERVSTMLACRIGIDAELLYFGNDGSKVSRYIENAETLSPETLCREDNIIKAARILWKLHTCGENTGVPFRVFDMAASYERIIRNNHVALYEDYDSIKASIMAIKRHIDKNGETEPVPCHNDPLCENWVLSGGDQLFLVDWEYAGMNDSMWDLADVSIEASFSHVQEETLLEAYFGRKPTVEEKARFQANKLYLDYLWTLWGKARVPFDGEPMEQYALERYERLKQNLREYEKLIQYH